jgi:Ca2+:H+ antiporter
VSFRREWLLLVSYGTVLAFSWYGDVLLAGLTDPVRLALVLLWLFGVVLGSSLRVVAHADELAHRLGEPYGTLLLTLSVTFIEVMSIAAVMLHGENNPTLARDTMFAVVMIVLNGMVGLSLLMGGWRHREQVYNLQGANSYLGAIIPLVVLGLVLPSFTQTTPGPTLSGAQQVFLVVVSVGLYAAFLAVQTGRHHGFFSLGGEAAGDAARHKARKDGGSHPILHAALLLGYLVPIVFLAEHLAVPIDYLIETLGVPVAFGGVLIAALVATPEAIGAIRAASKNEIQRSINIFLGSVLSTIGLTVPAMILVSRLTGHDLILGVEHADLVMLLLTLAVSVITFASGRTNVIQGAVHLVLFGAYLLLIVQD